jgi:uridine kinase
VSSPSRLALLEHLADLIAARQQPHPIRVAIDGVDAAGKTTLADELAALLAATGRRVPAAAVAQRRLGPAGLPGGRLQGDILDR